MPCVTSGQAVLKWQAFLGKDIDLNLAYEFE